MDISSPILQVIIIILSDYKTNSKYSISQWAHFWDRAIDVVGSLVHEGNTPCQLSDSLHCTHAEQHVYGNHRIKWNQKEYIKLRCSIVKYPSRDSYLQDIVPMKELLWQLRQREGIYLAMLEYLTIVTANKSNVIHLVWAEVPFVQVWTNFHHGDYQSPFIINSECGTANYTHEI